jgi:hypothetical protein
MDSITIEVLEEMLENIRKSGDAKRLKYFHLGTIDNFIYHFESIKHRKQREFILEKLHEYLTLIQSVEFVDTAKGQAIFHEYIYPISDVYNRYAGFFILPGNGMVSALCIVVFVLLYFLELSRWINLSVTIFLFLYITFLFIKKKQRKVYGYFL